MTKKNTLPWQLLRYYLLGGNWSLLIGLSSDEEYVLKKICHSRGEKKHGKYSHSNVVTVQIRNQGFGFAQSPPPRAGFNLTVFLKIGFLIIT